MATYDLELLSSLIDRAEVAISTAGGRQNLPRWIIENTRAPTNPLKNWSFRGHEFQIGILEDQNPNNSIQKCAQVGISELMVRMLLALAAKLTGEHLLLVLPTSAFSSKFVASRIDPVIQASPRLKSLVSKKVDSNEIKAIGQSFIHIGGAQNENQAISVPGRALFIDEKSFCDPDTLSVYQSRLEHQREEDRIQVSYSTPLYPGSGISEDFDAGSQKLYLCYHDACGSWVEVDSAKHIVLPGFDKPLTELTLLDLRSGLLNPDHAWVKCEHCGQPISIENLADPTRRAWVPKYPDRSASSFHIDPLAAPLVRPPAAVIRSLYHYKRTDRWVQFAIGQPFESADGTITQSALDNCFTITPQSPGTSGIQNAVAGMDQGKTAYIVNGKAVNGVLEIFNVETLKQDGENGQAETYLSRFKAYCSVRGVIDAGPDSSLVKYVQNRTQYNATWGCYFVRSARKASLDLFELDEDDGMVKAHRTGAIDAFVKAFNQGKIKLPKGLRDEEEIRRHLLEPKRIVVPDAVGEEQASWVSKSADHFFFSLLYCWLANQMVEEMPSTIYLPPSRLVSSVRMKQTPLPA
jgi:hypothetical protein